MRRTFRSKDASCSSSRRRASRRRASRRAPRGIAARAAAGIKLDIDLRLLALCCRYSSGGKTPDYDAADAFVALCTAILHSEGACRPAIKCAPNLESA